MAILSKEGTFNHWFGLVEIAPPPSHREQPSLLAAAQRLNGFGIFAVTLCSTEFRINIISAFSLKFIRTAFTKRDSTSDPQTSVLDLPLDGGPHCAPLEPPLLESAT